MSEDVARAVGAASPNEVEINGKKCRVKPVNVKELTEIQRECMKHYRNSYLQAYSESIEFLPAKKRESKLDAKIEEVSKWKMHDLPIMDVFDPSKIKVTDKLKDWLAKNVNPNETLMERDNFCKRVAASALDSRILDRETYKSLTGSEINPIKVGYVHWWVTADFEGLLTLVHHGLESLNGDTITRDDVISEFSKEYSKLVNLAREVEEVTQPEMGNG